jgi:DNA-binding MarR family transcriptional regulator
MTDTLNPLIRDFLAWIATEPKPYSEVMEAWRTSCPRLTVWEDAVDRGFVVRRRGDGRGMLIDLTPLGREFLQGNGRARAL